MRKIKLRIAFNAPVVLGFSLLCGAVLLLDVLTAHASTRSLFSVYRSSLSSPLTYLRFVGHVFGHSGPEHLLNNLMYILILGPMLEEKYGGKNIALLIFATALITGVIHFAFFPGVRVMGSSGVVFAMILLSSFAGFDGDSIPFTFILVAVLYIGQQLYQAFFVQEDVSYMAHLVGGAVGAGFGYFMNRKGRKRSY